MTNYEINKEKMPHLDEFPDSENPFLRDIGSKAQKWVMSDKQVWAANNAWEKGWTKPVKVELSEEDRLSLLHIIINYCPASNYYSQQGFLDDMRDKLDERESLTDKQYAALMKKFEYYRKSILNKIFGYVKPPSKRKKKI